MLKKITKSKTKQNIELKTKLVFKLSFLLLIISFASSSSAQLTAQERLDILVGRSPKPSASAEPARSVESSGPISSTAPRAIITPAERADVVTDATAEPTAVECPTVPEPAVGLPRQKIPTLRDQAFKDLLDRISPLNPEQIVEMRKQQDRTQRAVATTPDAPPRPVSSTLTIDLSPGAIPPVIRLGFGFVTSIVFVDSTGQSWPIADYNLGDPKHFNIQWDKKTNTLFMQSTTTYNNGNLAVRLATLNTPIMISLVSGQRDIDYRVDVQVPGRGPNAVTQVVTDSLPGAPNPLLLSVLDGVPPPGSQELEVCGGCGRAWLYKGKLIFRSQLQLLSPAWSATVSSLDGTRVYEINPTPLIIASHNGQPVKIVLKGF